jgi:hypothetical protein
MDIHPEDDELSDVLVTDYLRYYVLSSQGTKLFEYVFPPYSGDTREFIVKISLVAEAASYLEYGKGELARNMTESSIMEVFYSPEDAQEEAMNPPWKPFLQATNIPITEIRNPYQSDNKNKRIRYNMSEKRTTYTKPNHQNNNMQNMNQTPTQSPQSYLSVVTTKDTTMNTPQVPITGYNQTPVHSTTPNTLVTNATTQVFKPLAGLGGGLSPPEQTVINSTKQVEMENQIRRMEDDILLLKRSVTTATKSVQKLEENLKTDIQNIDEKINSSSNDLWKRVENKIDNNNALLQDQVSDILATKLAMNNMENNTSLLDRMDLLMQQHFEKMQDANNKTTKTLTTMSENQDNNIGQLNTKLEKTTKQLTEMIDNVALNKGQRSNKYITRSTIAKSLVLNATKITKSFMDNEDNEAIMEADEEVVFTMDTEHSSLTTTENKENQHEVTAIVEYCHK